MHVAIVGYGAAGQAASLFLAGQGHRLSVFERAPAPGPVGAGFLLQPTGLAVLAELGLHEQALAQGQRIESLHGCNTRGRQAMSRWLTPLFQSSHDRLAQWRDVAFGPLGRLPLARGQMLRILTGTKRSWWRWGGSVLPVIPPAQE